MVYHSIYIIVRHCLFGAARLYLRRSFGSSFSACSTDQPCLLYCRFFLTYQDTEHTCPLFVPGGYVCCLADGGTSLCIQALGQTALRFHVPDRKRIPDPHLEHPCLYFLFPVMPVPDAGVQQRPHYSHYEHNSLYVFHNAPSCLQTAFSFPSCFSVPL